VRRRPVTVRAHRPEGRRRAFLAAALVVALGGCGAPAARSQTAPLELERTIVLKDVAGRIDHLAFDAHRRRLFVAELGNGTVDAVDLDRGRVGQITGLREPQGLAFLPDRDELAVASGGDGSVRFYRGADLAEVGSVSLGSDADNLRVDARDGHLVAGYGSALAEIDPATRAVVRRTALPAHPEGFQLDGERTYVNLPDAGRLAVMDAATGREAAAWRNAGMAFNYPLAFDKAAGIVAVGFRAPAKLVIYEAASGVRLQQLDTCGDTDDLFFDAPGRRLYVICGGGGVDVFQREATGYARLSHVDSRRGARTGLFVPSLDRLFVAARSGLGGRDAAILVFRPRP
jgi:hypothetical protein